MGTSPCNRALAGADWCLNACAPDYEIQRQIGVLTAGGQVTMETRMFAWQEGVTKPLRTKERDKDYRYMPEADLPPLCLTEVWLYMMRLSRL